MFHRHPEEVLISVSELNQGGNCHCWEKDQNSFLKTNFFELFLDLHFCNSLLSRP